MRPRRDTAVLIGRHRPPEVGPETLADVPARLLRLAGKPAVPVVRVTTEGARWRSRWGRGATYRLPGVAIGASPRVRRGRTKKGREGPSLEVSRRSAPPLT